MRGTLGDSNRIVGLAARLFGTPIAVISSVDSDRVLFPSTFGLAISEVPRKGALCAAAIESDDVTVRTDVDAAVGGVQVRFYAGAPLIASDGRRLGMLAVMDTRKRAPLTD